MPRTWSFSSTLSFRLSETSVSGSLWAGVCLGVDEGEGAANWARRLGGGGGAPEFLAGVGLWTRLAQTGAS